MSNKGNLAAEELSIPLVEGILVKEDAQNLVDVVGQNDHAKQEEVGLDQHVYILLGEKLVDQIEREQESRANHWEHIGIS